MADSLPDRARVVVIGGGIAGASVAYHLTRLGWTDVVVLERRELTGGTTWHAAGLVTQLRASQTLIELARDAVNLYATLEEPRRADPPASGRPAASRSPAPRGAWTSSGTSSRWGASSA